MTLKVTDESKRINLSTEKAAIVLAGGFSKRFGRDKGLLQLAGKPLIVHVLDNISALVDELLVVVGSRNQEKAYAPLLQSKAKILIDKLAIQNPIIGALTGFENTSSRYSLILACDTPFVSRQIIHFLLENCVNNDAAIPRWPNSYLEPLQAAYNTKSALTATIETMDKKNPDMLKMIARLKKVHFVSTLVLQKLDPRLMTFVNVNTPSDFKKAEQMLSAADARQNL